MAVGLGNTRTDVRNLKSSFRGVRLMRKIPHDAEVTHTTAKVLGYANFGASPRPQLVQGAGSPVGSNV